MLHGRWSVENKSALEGLIGRDRARPPIAVFDWDNTCIVGDIADAVFHQLCIDLAFRFESPGFWDWVTEARCQDRISPAYQEYCTRPGKESRSRLRLGLEQTRKALHQGQDDASAWAWDTGAFVGWSEEEVRAYTLKVIKVDLARPKRIETFGMDGVEIEIATGLGIRAEMKELVRALQNADWDVWVISASPRWEIEAFAEIYGIPRERVVAMRREIVADRITAEVAPPVSYSDGKLDAYRTYVSRTEAPSFVAGDSLGDWKILESSEGVRLLVDPAPTALREFALWRKSAGETWLLQAFE